uniref:BPL-N domain-containing protein n=1 Tax=Alistipes sp. TaxID=1872444 RepID=UPI00405657DE
MKKLLIVAAIMATTSVLLPAQATASSKRDKARQAVLDRGRGYYKDIFMNSGIGLTSRRDLPVSESLKLSMEYFEGPDRRHKSTPQDSLLQANVFYGYEDDTNGWLLYPDGAPRFRMLYMNGGSAIKHAKSLTKEARDNVYKYVANGGSYVGTCAGAFFSSAGGYNAKRNKTRYTSYYIGLWPGYTHSTGLRKATTGMDIARRSPMLRYYDFGGDKFVKDVRHNGGCYAYDGERKPMPEGTEILAYYNFNDTEKVKIDGKPSVWAFKRGKESGRAILCGSHPEGVKSGERLDFMAAMVLYAMDGNPAPKPKATLKSGEVREMNKRTEDNDAAFTRIGDRQYHHFVVNVPRKCQKLEIALEGYEGGEKYDLTLCANYKELAYTDQAVKKVVSNGCTKTLTIDAPKAGRWYISVLCETTVSTDIGNNGTIYTGDLSVLNGVPYKISVKY